MSCAAQECMLYRTARIDEIYCMIEARNKEGGVALITDANNKVGGARGVVGIPACGPCRGHARLSVVLAGAVAGCLASYDSSPLLKCLLFHLGTSPVYVALVFCLRLASSLVIASPLFPFTICNSFWVPVSKETNHHGFT